MERLKKTNQTMLAVVGFLTAIIPAFYVYGKTI